MRTRTLKYLSLEQQNSSLGLENDCRHQESSIPFFFFLNLKVHKVSTTRAEEANQFF